jgi:2-polyprenyl-3-methyl-5-hydroxy-6-metoxy-1,4-benzoquinol methylase
MLRQLMRYVGVKVFGALWPIFRSDPSIFERWRWLAKYLKPGQHQTLDVGCGGGPFTFYAARIGNDAFGLDSDGSAIVRATEIAGVLRMNNLHFRIRDVRELDQETRNARRYDQVICCEVVEHILNDQKLLVDISTLLVDGGRLLLTTPYLHYRHLIGDTVSSIEDGTHVRWGYTHDQMRKLCNAASLTIIHENYVCGFICQMLLNLMRLLSTLVNPKVAWLLVFPLWIFLVVDPIVSRLIRYPFLCIAIVAAKQRTASASDDVSSTH